MTATTTFPGATTIIDDRPLKERLAEALHDRQVAHKALVVTGTALGATAGAGIGYINHMISLAFYAWIGMPAWFMTIATYSGYFAIAYLAVCGGWLVYAFAKD